MSFKVITLRIGKGRTIEEEGSWTKKYYEIEMAIEAENQIELAKNSGEALLDLWLKGECINKPQAAGERQTWDPSKIKWSQAEGSSGPYERSEDTSSLDHKAILKELAAHNGKLSRDGFFYWTFQNGWTVGRKKTS